MHRALPLLRLCRVALLLIALSAGCVAGRSPSAPPEWGAWQEKRLQSLTGTNGWLTLAGLFWLREGDNSVGADATNDVVLPSGKAPGAVGVLARAGNSVRFVAAGGVEVTVDGVPVRERELVSDASLTPTRLRVAGLTFWVLDRGERMGVRVRDPDSKARREFGGLTSFRYDPAWSLSGRFEPYREPGVLRVQDVTGGTQELRVAGDLVFERRGVTHRLQAIEEPGETELFVIFRDRTAGRTTYEAGRYLYVARPVSGHGVVLDFNRSYSPPCAFTPYATCPLPPRQNWLPFAIRAGERRPLEHP